MLLVFHRIYSNFLKICSMNQSIPLICKQAEKFSLSARSGSPEAVQDLKAFNQLWLKEMALCSDRDYVDKSVLYSAYVVSVSFSEGIENIHDDEREKLEELIIDFDESVSKYLGSIWE